MIVIPAIDIRGGRCVHLHRDERLSTADPLAVARMWARHGARWLHVIDFDGLASGHPVQVELLSALGTVGVPVQAGGGFHTLEDVHAGLACGVARVLLEAEDITVAADAARRFGECVAAFLTVGQDKGHRATRTLLDALTVAHDLVRVGIRRIVLTDLSRDGRLAGPDLRTLSALARAVRVPVIAAGGVRDEADVAALARLGLEGAVVGRALYEGRLSPKEVMGREVSS